MSRNGNVRHCNFSDIADIVDGMYDRETQNSDGMYIIYDIHSFFSLQREHGLVLVLTPHNI